MIVGAHDEQRRLRDERYLVHDGLAVDHLPRRDKGAQPARIFGAALDVETRIDERRHLLGRQLQRIIGLELLAVTLGRELVLVLQDLFGRCRRHIDPVVFKADRRGQHEMVDAVRIGPRDAHGEHAAKRMRDDVGLGDLQGVQQRHGVARQRVEMQVGPGF